VARADGTITRRVASAWIDHLLDREMVLMLEELALRRGDLVLYRRKAYGRPVTPPTDASGGSDLWGSRHRCRSSGIGNRRLSGSFVV